MEIKANILQFSVKGIKNITETTTLDFYKQTINKHFNMQGYNIKSIYGPNGVGKTAIIDAFSIIDELIWNRDYLANHKSILLDLINQQTQQADISILFCLQQAETHSMIQYNVTLTKQQNTITITRESLYSGTNKANNKIISIERGRDFQSDLKDSGSVQFLTQLEQNFQNTASNSSIIALLVDSLGQHSDIIVAKDTLLFYGMKSFILTTQQMYIKTDKTDDHSIYKYLCNYDDDDSLPVEESTSFNKSPKHRSQFDIILPRKFLEKFEQDNAILVKLLQILKPDIDTIELDMTDIDDASIIIHRYIRYKNGYKINVEFESSGIKKLLDLSALLVKASKGKIVIIDELDAHLHDIFLTHLLEYYVEYLEGQLIFTTHNLSPMEILKHNKKAIDFLTPTQGVISWVQKGNKSPLRAYTHGHILGLPFNYNFTDFILLFDTTKEGGNA